MLVDWIVDLAQHNGYLAQATSVAGVAQRTGATIYYIELFAQRHAEARGAQPVLAQMAVPGDVDIVSASELMEAGRAMQRGLVTPERTTLITSSHRDYATLEKVVPARLTSRLLYRLAVLKSGAAMPSGPSVAGASRTFAARASTAWRCWRTACPSGCCAAWTRTATAGWMTPSSSSR